MPQPGITPLLAQSERDFGQKGKVHKTPEAVHLPLHALHSPSPPDLAGLWAHRQNTAILLQISGTNREVLLIQSQKNRNCI